jgi:AhpD family alkylhydroperoxidase
VDKKIQEMIALGVSYVLNCRPCMEYHKKVAVEAGMTQKEMQEAIRLSEAVREGAIKKNKEFMESLFGPIREEQCCPAGSACCA